MRVAKGTNRVRLNGVICDRGDRLEEDDEEEDEQDEEEEEEEE